MNASSSKQYHLGFDLGGTKMLAVVYDQDLNPLQRKRVRTNGHEGSDAVIQRLLQSIDTVCDAYSVNPSDYIRTVVAHNVQSDLNQIQNGDTKIVFV